MSEFKQTWWDDNLDTRYDEFASWVGDSNSRSKVFFRNYIKEKKYTSLVDIGCGNATEFFAYQKEYPELQYTGVDSSKILNERNSKLGVPMILAPAENTELLSDFAEVAFSRHVLEHQPKFQPVLNEIIRLASKVAIHIFFIPPGDNSEHIGYDSSQNLYHNRYNKKDIEEYIISNPKVKKYEWINIENLESALIIYTSDQT
jgi:ubiquinone/menaquinone biosynthesis C-methylase UbiE